MPGAVTKIATATPSSTQSSGFTSIPGTYDDLMIIGSAKNAWTSGSGSLTNQIYIRINSDSTNDYGWARWGAESASTLGESQSTWDSIYLYANSSSASSNAGWGHFYMYFTGYTASAYKAIQMVGGYTQSSSQTQTGWTGQAMWLKTGAITDIAMNSTYGNYIAGTTFTLYGISYS